MMGIGFAFGRASVPPNGGLLAHNLPPRARSSTVRGKTLVLVLIGAILAVFGILIWVGMSGGSQHVPGATPGVGFVLVDAGRADEPDGARDAH